MSETKKSEKSLHEQVTDPKKSMLLRYKELVLGTASTWYMIKYELIMLTCAHTPGALGLFLRKLLYPKILKHVGKNVIFGQGINIIHGTKISIGDNVILADRVVLDAKGETNHGITIANDTTISRNVILACKNGSISIGSRCSIGINTLIHAVKGSDVKLGSDVLVGAFSYFVGGGTYSTEKLDIPFKEQNAICRGGINIADNIWVGAYVQVFDGVSVGTGSILGANTVVTKDVSEYDVVAGTPMKVIKSRKKA